MNNVLVSNYPVTISSLRFNLSLKFFWVLVFCLILSLLITCIIQFNAYTKEIYLIQNHEKKLNQLTQENKILEINYSNANSLINIGNYVQKQAFEKVNEVKYIRVLEGTALAK